MVDVLEILLGALIAAVAGALDIRGHIPQFDDYRPSRREPVMADAAATLRTVAEFVATFAGLAVLMAGAAWLAIRMLS
jgi:uncharacterized membrane protein